MMKKVAILVLFVAGFFVGTAAAQPPEDYVSVSTILELPDFIPGVGALFIDPANAPVGPGWPTNRPTPS